jgi:ATPase subunit of ABC transporter with duplicated ATPase domains
MLDVPSITFLSNYLQNYPSTVFVVSHDRAFLNEIATDIVHQHSERLDYYRGANFGKFSWHTRANSTNICRYLLRDQRGATQECEAGVRETDVRESSSPRSVFGFTFI